MYTIRPTSKDVTEIIPEETWRMITDKDRMALTLLHDSYNHKIDMRTLYAKLDAIYRNTVCSDYRAMALDSLYKSMRLLMEDRLVESRK